MKSEKAKEYIDKEILRMDNEHLKYSYGYDEKRDGISYLEIDEVRKAVELAEQETEERMRREAEEAFLSCCYCEEHQYVRKKCENCEAYKSFIQILNDKKQE